MGLVIPDPIKGYSLSEALQQYVQFAGADGPARLSWTDWCFQTMEKTLSFFSWFGTEYSLSEQLLKLEGHSSLPGSVALVALSKVLKKKVVVFITNMDRPTYRSATPLGEFSSGLVDGQRFQRNDAIYLAYHNYRYYPMLQSEPEVRSINEQASRLNVAARPFVPNFQRVVKGQESDSEHSEPDQSSKTDVFKALKDYVPYYRAYFSDRVLTDQEVVELIRQFSEGTGEEYDSLIELLAEAGHISYESETAESKHLTKTLALHIVEFWTKNLHDSELNAHRIPYGRSSYRIDSNDEKAGSQFWNV